MSEVYIDTDPLDLDSRPGKGPLDSRYAFVGIAPSTKRPKNRANEPFGSSSHKLLQKILGAVEEEIYVSNIVKTPIKPGKKPGVKIIRKHYPGLIHELNAVFDVHEIDHSKPIPRVLAIGSIPAKFLCPYFKKMREDHGTFFFNPEIQAYVLPTYHFAACARDPSKLEILAHDLQRFFSLPDPVKPEFEIVNSFADWNVSPAVLDIETTGFDVYQDECLSIGIMGPARTPYILEKPSVEQITETLQALEKSKIIGHNLPFDLHFLGTKANQPVDKFRVMDTMMMAHVLGYENRTLKHLTTMHTDRPGSRGFGGPEDPAYLAEDLLSTQEVHDYFLPQVEGLYALELLNKVTPVVAEMRYTGVHLDEEKLDELIPPFQERVDINLASLNESAGYDLNWNSNPQVCDFLLEKGVHLTKKTPGGAFSVAEDVLTALKARYPQVGKILALREAQKHLGFLVDYKAEIDQVPDRRLHPRQKLTGTKTGRLAMSDPNLQQVLRIGPTKLVFVSRFENGLMGLTDLAQAELRVAALLSNDHALAEALLSDDIHTAIAARVFECALDEVTPAQRKKSKGVTFGLLYGGSPEGLAKRVGASVREVERILSEVFGMFPDLAKWLEDTGEAALLSNLSGTIFGRVRDLTYLAAYEGEASVRRKAVNTPIQGLASDIMLQILGETAIRFQEALSLTLFGVHDSSILDIHPDEVDLSFYAVDQAFKSLNNTPLSELELWGQLPIVGELILGKSWAHIESTNENYAPDYTFDCSSAGDLASFSHEPPEENDQEAFDVTAAFDSDELWGDDVSV